MSKSLEVNFYGPIAFRMCKNEAWAFLPKCRDHYCNILTDQNDISPKRRRIFEVVGPKSGLTQLGSGALIVQRNWDKKWGPKPLDCYCIFKLPSPDKVFGLRGEYVKIDIPKETSLEGIYARGIRFWYADCPVAPAIMPADGAAAGDLHYFDASYCGHDDLYQVEIRYHDARHQPSIDHHHRDAMACSRSMRKLFPPCEKWKVNFEPPKKSHDMHILIGGKHPIDCGANSIVFNDGSNL
jgi:hypothetical protein